MELERQVEELRSLLGEAAVLTGAEDLSRYTRPYRGVPGPTPAVVRPADVDQVRAVVGWARRHRVRLLPQGANSGLAGASTPPPAGAHPAPVVVSLERLDREPMVDPVDRTAEVAAGTRLSRLNTAALPHGLVLPIDLGADPSLGGMVATNTGGARMLRHGDMRRHVLGVRAVTADADCTVVDERTTLRKHNVGPSLTQWFIGTSGAFGIVTDVVVDLGRLPAARACAWMIPRDAVAALETILLLERSYGRWLEAFEVLSAEALEAAVREVGDRGPFGSRPSPWLSALVEFSGGEESEEVLVGALDDLTSRSLISDAVVVPPVRAWAYRHAVTDGLQRSGTVLGFDVSVPRSHLPPFRDRVREAVASVAPQAIVADFGHWGDGGIHCNVVLPAGVTVEAPIRVALDEAVIGTACAEFGGSFSAEHGVGPRNAGWWTSTTGIGTRSLVAGLKQVFDPLGVLGHPGLPYRWEPGSS
jgi:FAD/FMN-containing dehydrogenase